MDEQRVRIRRALREWNRFPAAHQPRPLVLLGSMVQPGAFPSGEAKMACLCGAFDAVAGVSDEVLAILRSPGGDFSGTPLLVTSATRGVHQFCTDRGRHNLPAWRVDIRGGTEPIWVLDPGLADRVWHPELLEDYESSRGNWAVVGADARTVTLHFTGGDARYSSYPHAEVWESAAVVAMLPVEIDVGPPGRRAAS